MMNVIKGALGQEKFKEFQVGLWSQAAKGEKELADTVGLTIETPRDIDEAMALIAVTSMGPEFEFKTFVRRMISVDICALLDSPNTESQIMR